MSLYVVTVPDPPPGVDWTTMVPGYQLWDVTGITATLVSASGPSPNALDASGVGNDGTYPNGHQLLAGLVPGDDAMGASSGVGEYLLVQHPVVAWTGDWTIEYLTQTVGGQYGWGFIASVGTGAHPSQFLQFAGGPPNDYLFLQATGAGLVGGVWQSPNGSFPSDGLPHLVGVTYVSGTDTLAFYVDGVNVGAVENFGPWGALNLLDTLFLNHNPAFPTVGQDAYVDELAVYATALSGAQMAAHQAARGAFGTYAAAVLADGPSAYYHLDDTLIGGGRTPNLQITDGTHLVQSISPAFAAVTQPGPYNYSWQPSSGSNAQTADGTLTTIGTPPLVLPGGYTIGTSTPDLQPTDQWSNVVLWWSTDIMDLLAEFNPYAYPPGATLQYRQIGASP